MTSRHQVSELDSINGTNSRPKSQPKSRPESGPSWDHVGTKSGPSGDQVISKSPTQLATQLHKISSSNYYIRLVTDQVVNQVGEQVTATNHKEHRGHGDLAAEIKSTAKVAARVTAKVTTYLGASKT
ncbi:hypothetical protein PV02_11650 [Methanolobus chelungpuianus]|uniref:Uncharacterized protein n=1 Tax=Methanolobus chelungpuianus TaxID=502115 RepID=A0AAE3HE51_9EURY|nr:hypothetical protein [Methanolobus chelungpuianus]